MTMTPKRLLTALLLTGLILPGTAMAQAAACGQEREVKQGLMDEATWKRMNTAYELVGEEEYDKAMEELVFVEKRAKEPYMQAVVAQGIAQVHWAKQNFDAALQNFEKAVELDALPDRTHYSLMYQIAQLYYSKDRYDEALDRLALWFCKVPEDQHKASAYVLKASIYAQKEDWQEVINAISTAIDMSDELNENWYGLKLAGHFELEQFDEAIATLEVMLTHWPAKKQYWVQLSNTHYKLENDGEALSVIALAYRNGLLDKQNDILYLSNLYSMRDVPYKAAEVMQAGLEAGVVENDEKYWTMVGDNWYAAEEYDEALYAFEKAGQVADDGEIDLRRGYILVDQEKWGDAIEALSTAIDKGGLGENKTGEAYLMLGMANFNQQNWSAASTAWGRAGRYDRTRDQARQWMSHMQEERARIGSSGP